MPTSVLQPPALRAAAGEFPSVSDRINAPEIGQPPAGRERRGVPVAAPAHLAGQFVVARAEPAELDQPLADVAGQAPAAADCAQEHVALDVLAEQVPAADLSRGDHPHAHGGDYTA